MSGSGPFLEDQRLRSEAILRERDEAHSEVRRTYNEMREVMRERDAVISALNDTAVFIGPCAHERDPWDRCDECAKDNALWAATKAVTARTKERDEARAEAAMLKDECASISAEFGLPPTIRPSEGEIRRILDGWKEARAEAEAENAAWRKATGYSDPEALDSYLGRAGIDAHLKVWTEMLEKRAAEVERLLAEVARLEGWNSLHNRHMDCTGSTIPCVPQAPCRRHMWEVEMHARCSTVAERQREACAKAGEKYCRTYPELQIIEEVRATPLVTEGGK